MTGDGKHLDPWAPLPPLIGTSGAIRRAAQLIERYGATSVPILVVGPTGTGKELVARHIHARSNRPGRFVPVNCAALPREMAESLLFGHRRGAFSGALETRRGHVERADGGTLFLDELLCLSAESQAKLLRALDTGEIQPLGEEHERYVDLRVVAAAPDTIAKEREEGGLRLDLYQRVASVLIVLPPLEQRPHDIVPIARYFTERAGRTLERKAARALERHAWPGNVRELRYVIERAGWLVDNGTICAAAVAEAIAIGSLPNGLRRAGADGRPWPTREELLASCQANDWDMERVAAAFGLRRTALYERMRAVGTGVRDLRTSASSGERSADNADVRARLRV